MSIQSEITLLQGTKKEIRNAIMEKGVTVSPSDLFSSYPTRISQISMTPGDKDTLFRSMIERTETSLVIPTGTEVIRYGGFTHYDTLASITIPDTVTTIEDAVFVASGLTSVTIPKNVTSIGSDALRGCSSLASITVNAETPPTLGTRAFDNTNDCPILVPEDSVEAYRTAWSQYADRIQAIPVPAMKWVSLDGTQEISVACEDLETSGTFGNTDRTTADPDNLMSTVDGSAEIGNCVTELGNASFNGCSSLINIYIPNSVKKIGSGVFQFCSKLASINIPDSVTTIGYLAFGDCTSLTDIVIPSSVKNIGSIILKGCTSLASITVDNTVPPSLSLFKDSFDGTNDCPIYVPSGSLETYLANSSWAVYKDRLFERGVAKWTEQSFECEVDETDTKTGMVTVVEKDTNPSSPSYNQTRSRTYEDERCSSTQSFIKITSLDAVTSGKYLIVDTANNIALNASLIASTTSTTNGINAFGDHISVGITDDTIEATDTTLNAAVDYDGSNLTWTDENTGIYYLSPPNTDSYTNFNTSTSYPQGSVTPYLNTTNGGITFKASYLSMAIALFTRSSNKSKFRWQPTKTDSPFANMALFKLN